MAHQHTIVITGGHLSPAWATIEQLQHQNVRIEYFGRRFLSSHAGKSPSDEYQIVNQHHIPFHDIVSGKLHRHSLISAIFSTAKVPLGIMQSLLLLHKIRPCSVLSFGSYLSVPVVFAAWLLRIPILTHEQTRYAGLANKINARFSTRVAVSFPESLSQFPPSITKLTGNPIRTQALHIDHQLPGLESIASLPTILIMCGNQGSYDVNSTILNSLDQLLTRYNLIHAFGVHPDQQPLLQQAQTHIGKHPGTYIPIQYISPEHIGSAFAAAKLVISRAGANTCTELAHLAKPSILIPLPAGQHNEQLANAQLLQQLGISETIHESMLTPQLLLATLDQMSANLGRYQAPSSKVAELFPLNAAEKIADLAIGLCVDRV